MREGRDSFCVAGQPRPEAQAQVGKEYIPDTMTKEG